MDLIGIQSFWRENRTALIEKFQTSINPIFKALKYAIQHGQSKPNKLEKNTKRRKLDEVYNRTETEIKTYIDKCENAKDCTVPNPGTIYQHAMTTKQQLDPENTFQVDPWFLMRFINQNIDEIRPILEKKQSQITENESLHQKIEKEKQKITQNSILIPKHDVQVYGIMKEFKNYLIEMARYDDCAQKLWNGIEIWSQLSQTEQLNKFFIELVLKLRKDYKDSTDLQESAIILLLQDKYKLNFPDLKQDKDTTTLFNYYAQKQLFLLYNRFSISDENQLNLLMQQAIRVLAEQWMLKTDESKEYWWYVEKLESRNVKEIIAEIYNKSEEKIKKLNEQLKKVSESLQENESLNARQTENERNNPLLLQILDRVKRRQDLKKKIRELTTEKETIFSKMEKVKKINESYWNPKLIKVESYMEAFLKYIDPTCEEYVKAFLKMRRSRNM